MDRERHILRNEGRRSKSGGSGVAASISNELKPSCKRRQRVYSVRYTKTSKYEVERRYAHFERALAQGPPRPDSAKRAAEWPKDLTQLPELEAILATAVGHREA